MIRGHPSHFWVLVLSGFTCFLATSTVPKVEVFFRRSLYSRGAQRVGVPGLTFQVVVFLMQGGHGTRAHLDGGDLGPGASPALCPGASRSTGNDFPSV